MSWTETAAISMRLFEYGARLGLGTIFQPHKVGGRVAVAVIESSCVDKEVKGLDEGDREKIASAGYARNNPNKVPAISRILSSKTDKSSLYSTLGIDTLGTIA
jgi:hypothetical protein